MADCIFTTPDGRRYVRIERPEAADIPFCRWCHRRHPAAERHLGSPSDWRSGWAAFAVHRADKQLAVELGLVE